MAQRKKKVSAKKAAAPKKEAVEQAIDMSAPAAPVIQGKDPDALVSINIPVRLKIKRKVYPPGQHKVPRHMIPTMMEMVDKKRRADLEMFTGKNYLVQRLVDRSLVVSEVENLDLKQMAR